MTCKSAFIITWQSQCGHTIDLRINLLAVLEGLTETILSDVVTLFSISSPTVATLSCAGHRPSSPSTSGDHPPARKPKRSLGSLLKSSETETESALSTTSTPKQKVRSEIDTYMTLKSLMENKILSFGGECMRWQFLFWVM